MEYIINENGKVKHGCGLSLPNGAIEVANFKGCVGDPWEHYKNGIKLSDEKLIEKGLIVDDRGIYYTDDKRKIIISSVDVEKKPEWTTSKWNHITDKLVGGKWIEQAEEKQKYEQNIINSEAISYLASTDWYAIRKNETGKKIPADIIAKRKEARLKVERS